MLNSDFIDNTNFIFQLRGSVQVELFADCGSFINTKIPYDGKLPGARLYFSQPDQPRSKFKVNKLRGQLVAVDHKRLISPEFLLAQKPDGNASSL